MQLAVVKLDTERMNWLVIYLPEVVKIHFILTFKAFIPRPSNRVLQPQNAKLATPTQRVFIGKVEKS